MQELQLQRGRSANAMPMKVLVVDDSATMLMNPKATLIMNGVEVETAGNGRGALKARRGEGKQKGATGWLVKPVRATT